MSIKSIFSIMLLITPFVSHAAILQNGDILKFTTGSFIEGTGASGAAPDSAIVDALNGLIIGSAQPGFPDIDQAWVSTQGIAGNHRTSSAVTVIDETTLDFSGWIMFAGGSDYAFGLTQDIASYNYDGTNFTLDYYWDAATDNGGNFLGPLALADYHLHLVGTVVPIPAAVWLFGSGLIGLIGVARRKASTVY